MSGSTDLDAMLRDLEPILLEGEFVFVSVDASSASVASPPSLATISEPEGMTLVMRREDADAASLHYDFVAGWISLTVHSALEAVGLTAAVSSALAAADISCNILAGYHHDHLLVPHDRIDQALEVLRRLSDGA
ncbi:MAG TPA: ACT domain-containing protein [Lacisediminihabitans sp.]|uniref:ACT domain-containing protein n=1 Tax=Lacisediminihabitans sp. TaxID=2787631 RepID=UPI002ED87B3E